MTFCAAPGTGAGIPSAGCTADSCATCATATAGGDNGSNPITISASGQHRTVITACGASNDLDTVSLLPCGWPVADVSRRGSLCRPGVSVNYGYDCPAVVCRKQRLGRPCSDTRTLSMQGFDLTLAAGTAYLYVVTSVPSTIVVETLLP